MTAAARIRNLAHRVELLKVRATQSHPAYANALHDEAGQLAQYAERIARQAAVMERWQQARAAA